VNSTQLEKKLIVLCLLLTLMLVVVFLNRKITKPCSPPVHPTPDMYEESDSYLSTGQGKLI